MSTTRPGDDPTPRAGEGGAYRKTPTQLATDPAFTNTYAQTAKIVRARAGRLDVWGHSYAFGIGASDLSKRFGSLIADSLRLREQNDAISGTAVTSDASGASWAKALQFVTRPSRGAVSGSGVTSSSQPGFSTPGGVFVGMYGVNDVNSLGNTVSAQEPTRLALRSVISRWRAGAIFEDSDATFTFTGTWVTQSDTTKNSGAAYHYTTSGAATYSITTPADFPGGTIAIGIHSQSPSGGGATHTATYNGATYTIDAHNPRSGSATPHVLRIPNVAAGTQTITVALSSLVTLTAVDYWQWEPATVDCPLVVLLKQPYPVDYSSYGNTPPGPPTDAGVDVLNQIIADVAAEFDERVITVDLSGMSKDATMFAADKLHPSDKGHQYIAGRVIAAIKTAGFVVEAGRAILPREDYGTAAPTGTRTYYLVGDRVINTVPAEAGSAASKYITTGWICTVEGRPGTWLEQRVLTGN